MTSLNGTNYVYNNNYDLETSSGSGVSFGDWKQQ